MIWCLLFSMFSSAEPLKWGADPEGGAPYIFADPADPKTWIGYEVDIMRELGRELGQGETFVQNPWDSLIPSLQRGTYDAAVNGLEITDDRKQVIAFSDPYYVTYLQLTVRHDNQNIHSLKGCALQRVGTLKGTLAQRILDNDANIEVITYESQVTVYEDLALGRIAAVLLDWPIAQYYAVPNRKLKNVGAPIARVLYGIGVRKSDTKLVVEINSALERLWAKGTMREIYERWGLWNALVAAEFSRFGTSQPTTTQPTEYQKYLKSVGAERTWHDQVQKYWGILPILGQGALITIKVSVFSMLVAMFVGLWIALGRLYGPSAVSRAMIWYVEVMRGTPLLVQLYLIFYGLPNIGIRLSPIVAAVIGLGLNYAACESENYRAGILSIPRSQMDAALALGMSRFQALWHIVLPQAVRVAIPPVTNDFIALLKDSSLVSLITMIELSHLYYQLAATYYDYLGIGLLVAAIYFLIGLPFVRLSRELEKRLAYDRPEK